MAQQRRVVVVYTGGTLGMVDGEQGWHPGADLTGWLAGLMRRHHPDVACEVLTLEPLVDSSNVRPAEWQRIVDVVREQQATADGVVVLHGTDTMAYTAAALHYALAGGSTRVVVTGAQRSLVVPDSDAPANVMGAIACALDPRVRGVALFFDGELFAPDAVTKTSSVADHGFGSPNRPTLAEVRADGELVVHAVDWPVAEPVADPKPFREADLVVLTLHPGLQAARVRAMLTPAPEAVLVRAYGTGNSPDNDPELLAALREAHDAGALLMVLSQCPHGGVELGHYAVSQGLLAASAVSGGRLETGAAIALLTWLFSQGMGRDEVAARIARTAERG